MQEYLWYLWFLRRNSFIYQNQLFGIFNPKSYLFISQLYIAFILYCISASGFLSYDGNQFECMLGLSDANFVYRQRVIIIYKYNRLHMVSFEFANFFFIFNLYMAYQCMTVQCIVEGCVGRQSILLLQKILDGAEGSSKKKSFLITDI